MFIHNLSYLAILRNIEVLGLEMLTYIKFEFPTLYKEMIKYVINSEHTQYSSLQGMLNLQGVAYITDVIRVFIEEPYLKTNVFSALYKAQKLLKKIVLDTRSLDIALRFKMANAISDTELRNILRLGIEADERRIEARLFKKSKQLRETLQVQNEEEIASEIIFDKIEEIISLLQKVFRKEVK